MPTAEKLPGSGGMMTMGIDNSRASAAHRGMAVRTRGDTVADRQKIREFHFTLYAIAAQPTLLRMIESLWLQTGPYMNLLYPDFIASPRGPERRLRIVKALQAHDGTTARREMQGDIGDALSYVAGLADAPRPAPPVRGVHGYRRVPPVGAAHPPGVAALDRAERLTPHHFRHGLDGRRVLRRYGQQDSAVVFESVRVA